MPRIRRYVKQLQAEVASRTCKAEVFSFAMYFFKAEVFSFTMYFWSHFKAELKEGFTKTLWTWFMASRRERNPDSRRGR